MKLKLFESRNSITHSRPALIAHLVLSGLLVAIALGAWYAIIVSYEARKLTCTDRGCAVSEVSGLFSSASSVWSGKRPMSLLKHPQGKETGISIVDNNGDTYRLTALGEGSQRSDELEKALKGLEPGLNFTLSQNSFGFEWWLAALALLVGSVANLVASVRSFVNWSPPAP